VPHRILTFTGSDLFLGFLLKKKWNSKLIRFRTESYSMKRNIFNRILYSNCDLVIAGNEEIKKEIGDFGFKKVELIYAGVDETKFVVKPLPQQVRIGYLGRLDKVKGIEVLWDVMNDVWREFPDIELLIAGKEEYYRWNEIKHRFKGKVRYVGFLEEEKVPEFLASCSIGLITSVGSEATSRALLEWWAVGRPVIVTDVGIMPELIENNVNGIIVSKGDVQKFSKALKDLIKNRDKIEQLSKNARKKIDDEFSIKNFEKKLEICFNLL
ncbi:MAG: glycosyltransferase family 4 protein, partial [Elusimicrobia bacterium]|nr:glycosyltransferase family 4 protein [Elusimicrobiota bacterium]